MGDRHGCLDCGDPADTRGYCHVCYDRRKRTGDLPTVQRHLPLDDRIEDYRFLAAQGLAQHEIAERMGVTTRHVQRYAAAAKGRA